MKIEEVSKCNAGSDWSIFYWLLGLVLMPIALPLAAINYWQRWQARRFRKLLPGKVVLITGASSGLGEALAHVFYKAHCRVILAARRVQELERVKRDLLALDVEPSAYVPTILQLDLSELNDIPAFVKQALSVHNHIDILINNGGISVRADALSSGVDVDLKVMLVNYFGSIALTKALLPSMLKRQQGQVCFISSVQGKFALPHRSAYSASKHAVQAFADSLRAEVGHKGINVCCVSPGYIKTQLSINALTASGAKYGKMDKTTAKGMSPEKLAMRIFNALMCRENEIVVCDAQAKVAHYLRCLFPSIYFWLMSKRAIKLERETAAVEPEKKDT